MKFDEILVHIGEFGCYQKRVYFILCLPAMLCGLQVLSTVFIMATPPHRCKLPGYTNDTYEVQGPHHQYLINLTIPPGEDGAGLYSECYVYSDVNGTGHNVTSQRGTSHCSEWVFEKTEFDNTIIEEFSFVCRDTILRSHSNMVLFAGALCGSVFMGIIADIVGRKKAIMLSLSIQFVTALAIYLSPTYEMMIAFRGLAGVATQSLFAVSASTGIELVGPTKRTFTGVVVEMYWCAGIFLLLPVAFVLRDWRNIQLFLCLITIPLFSMWWLIPESPRWLLDKQKFSEARQVLERICQSNKTKLPRDAIDAETASEGPQGKIWQMFTHRVLIIRTLIIFFNWLAVNLLYYGLSLNLDNLAGSSYFNYLIGTLVEFVAYVICLLLLDRTGRKKLHCICMFTGAAACLAVMIPVTFAGQSHQWIATCLSMVGKLSASGCYAILYIMSAELFPTVMRNSGIGCCSIFESLGGMISPYIADMGLMIGGAFAQGLPMVVFGTVSVLAGFLSLALPETLHRTLPESIQDAIDFDKQPKSSKNGVGQTNGFKHPEVELELVVPLTKV
ncbi:organic cation transporter protein-like [Physella acuta]|uniref:organic cation transporter protein-like n=1 Tax=Physella acuta TaxID=109671 RepID=UPI0027DB7794|nr:organic cation transporter protein-like [Physella acuta]